MIDNVSFARPYNVSHETKIHVYYNYVLFVYCVEGFIINQPGVYLLHGVPLIIVLVRLVDC